jgi:GDPmannose 4,6-dehydratase
MWRILQREEADDYVLATGETHTVRTFVEKAFHHTGRPIVWQGQGVDEVGRCSQTGDIRVRVDQRYFRPTEVDLLIGDPTKARERLGWQHKVTLDDLVKEMVTADVERIRRDHNVRGRYA